MKKIRTSYIYNEKMELLKGFPTISLSCAVYGAFIGLFISSKISGPNSLSTIILVLSVVIPFSLSKKAIKGEYDFQGWEIFLLKLKSKLFGKEELVMLEQEVPIKKEAGYIVHAFDGTHVIGFKINYAAENILIDCFRNLLKSLPSNYRIQFIRTSEKLKTSKPHLKIINTCNYYILCEFRRSDISHSDWKKNLFQTLDSYGSQLNTDEIQELFTKIIYLDKHQEWEDKNNIFRSPISILRDKSLCNVGQVEGKAMALSLARMPQNISSNFQKIFEIMNRVEGTISVKFQGLGEQNPLMGLLRDRMLENAKKKGNNPESKNRVNLRMTMQAFLHGIPDKLDELVFDLGKEVGNLPEEEKPVFVKETAYLKKAVANLLPGRGSLHQRFLNVFDVKEAMAYLPRPLEDGGKYGLIPFRTGANSIYNFNLHHDKPAYFFADVGKGKSVFLGKLQLLFIGRDKEDGKQQASFAMEAGGTFKFLRDGLADASFVLEKDEHQNYLPLDFHPLRFLLAYGDTGLEKAKNWIMGLCKSESDVLKQICGTTLEEMKNTEIYSLNEFHLIFTGYVKKSYPDKDIATDHSSKSALLNLSQFVKGSIYGKIFDPAKSKDVDFNSLRHFYVSQKNATAESEDLLKAFYSLGVAVLESVESNFDSRNIDFFIALDELEFLKQYIGYEKLLYLNTQGRKQGKFNCFSSQSLSDVVPEKDEYKLLISFKRFFCAGGLDNPGLIPRALKLGTNNTGFLEKYDEYMEKVNDLRMKKHNYSWLYIDEHGEFRILMVDLEQHEKWLMATFPEAKKIREKVMKKTGLDYWQTCKMLAIYGPGEPPRTHAIPDEAVENMLERIWNHKELYYD